MNTPFPAPAPMPAPPSRACLHALPGNGIMVLSIIWTARSPAPLATSGAMISSWSPEPGARSPAPGHRANLRQTVFHLPKRSGRSRQGEPVRAIRKMPSRICRLSIAGRRARLRIGGRNGASSAQARVVDDVSVQGRFPFSSLASCRWRYGNPFCPHGLAGTLVGAEQGNADAQFNLGVMYDNGEDVPQDHAEAARWYRRAAEQEHASGQYNLGTMYAFGEDVPQDHAEALKSYRRAAEQGNADAQSEPPPGLPEAPTLEWDGAIMAATTTTHSAEVGKRAVRLVQGSQDNQGKPDQHGSRWQAVMLMSAKIGRAPQTLHERAKRAEVDSGKRAGIPADMAKTKALEREGRELKQANEILRKASAYFAPSRGLQANRERAGGRSLIARSNDDPIYRRSPR
jgi:transposase